MGKTTIQISKEVREALGRLRVAKRESYDEILRRKVIKEKLKSSVDNVPEKVSKSDLGKRLKNEYGL